MITLAIAFRRYTDVVMLRKRKEEFKRYIDIKP